MDIIQLRNTYPDLGPDNIDRFVEDVRTSLSSSQIKPLIAIGFLSDIADRFDKQWQQEAEELVNVHGKALAVLLRVLYESHTLNELSRRIVQFLRCSSATRHRTEDLFRTAVLATSRQCTSLGITWQSIRNAKTIDTLTYFLCNDSVFGGEPLEPFRFRGKGLVTVSDGVLTLHSSPVPESSALAFTTGGGTMEVYTRNSREEKLKASMADKASGLGEFRKTFLYTQKEDHRSAAPGRKLSVGDTVAIECLNFDTDDKGYTHLRVRALGVQGVAEGYLCNEELIKGAYTEDLFDYLCENDCIRGAKVIEAGDAPLFSIKDAYTNFAVSEAREDEKRSSVFEAKVVEVLEDKQRINWITASGYGAISLMMEGVKAGDIALMTMKNVQRNNNKTYINICPPKYGYDSVSKRFDADEVLSGLRMSLEEYYKAEEQDEDAEGHLAGSDTVCTFAQLLSEGGSGSGSMDKYRRLLAAEFLYTAAGSPEKADQLGGQIEYLGDILQFAEGEQVRAPGEDTAMTAGEASIVKALSLFGREDAEQRIVNSPELQDTGTTSGDIASMVIALAISGRHGDEVKVDPDALRLAICRELGVSDHFSRNDSPATGKYRSEEGQMVEFKSSYVMRNDGGGADIDYQGRGQVFEAVCGFLNSDGGVVYIGVNDSGDPIVSDNYGIKGDIAWFRKNFGTIAQKRAHMLGHAVTEPDSVDHYCLFLNSEKELYFKPSVQGNIIIEPTPNGDAIRITVRPSAFEIAYLYEDNTYSKGIAYQRNGNRTVPMTQGAMTQRLMSLKSISKEVGFIPMIQEAIDRKRKLIFRGYSSLSSGTARDRLVVPINLSYNDEYVYCYDLDEKDFRQFRLARIASIDAAVTNPEYPHVFEPKAADIFRWIGGKDYHIRVRMDTGARNLLMDEYSAARNLPAEELHEEEDGSWILDTHVHGLEAIRRFYLGLADRLEILPTEDSPALLRSIRSFVEAHLSPGGNPRSE